MTAPATRVAHALARRGARTAVSAGLQDLSVMKTTQSGYTGFNRDALTTLPETRERMLATIVAATWTYAQPPADYDAAYDATLAALCETFFGPARGGVYSPGVQATLYAMGSAALARVPAMDNITLTLPNLHFLPLLPAGIPFDNDVYVATSEPHGTIQATISRAVAFAPRPRL
jgi:urate oxidase